MDSRAFGFGVWLRRIERRLLAAAVVLSHGAPLAAAAAAGAATATATAATAEEATPLLPVPTAAIFSSGRTTWLIQQLEEVLLRLLPVLHHHHHHHHHGHHHHRKKHSRKYHSCGHYTKPYRTPCPCSRCMPLPLHHRPVKLLADPTPVKAPKHKPSVGKIPAGGASSVRGRLAVSQEAGDRCLELRAKGQCFGV